MRVLGRLVRMGVLERHDALRPGFPPEFRPSDRFEALTGLRRVGDALVLAASLLSQAPVLRSRPQQAGDRAEDDAGGWDR